MIAPLNVRGCSLVAIVASLACSGSGETLIDGAVDAVPPDTAVDAGCDASWRREVLATGDVSVQNSIAIDASGGIHIARYDRATATIVYTTNVSGTWSSETVATLTDPGLPDPAIVVDSEAHVDVAYLDRRGRDVWFASRTASTWTHEPVETNTPGGSSLDMVVGRDGVMRVAYSRTQAGGVALAIRPSMTWDVTTVDGAAASGDVAVLDNPPGKTTVAYRRFSPPAAMIASDASGAFSPIPLPFDGAFANLGRAPNDDVLLAYTREPSGELGYSLYAGGTWTHYPTGVVADYVHDVATLRDGSFAVLYRATAGRELRLGTVRGGQLTSEPIDAVGDAGLSAAIATHGAEIHIAYRREGAQPELVHAWTCR
ncbi:MAG: hypothetical protein IPH44_08650 [Myxococcales bacterium]|jgi:hypothetical protein|nr:hypothetical protein [Myxococcales bacterium]MBK7198619.1 hypothetical protein [Myxococcales bacterium]MBP6846040.1 hypothetical protein [Kofleriaceae bacterium]